MNYIQSYQQKVRYPGADKTFVYFASVIGSEIHIELLLHRSPPKMGKMGPLCYSFINPFSLIHSISFILL